VPAGYLRAGEENRTAARAYNVGQERRSRFEVLVQRMGVRPIHIDLSEDRKADPIPVHKRADLFFAAFIRFKGDDFFPFSDINGPEP